MDYSYSSGSGDGNVRAFFIKKARHIAVAAVVVFLIGSFYLVGKTITTYATYSKSLETELNDTQNALLQEQEQKEACESLLGTAQSSLGVCSSNLDSAKGSLNSCQNNVAQLSRDVNTLSNKSASLSRSLDACNAEKDTSSQSHKQLARNSVRAICCSFSDTQSSVVRNWNVVNNSIVCSGGYTINCTSGESNY